MIAGLRLSGSGCGMVLHAGDQDVSAGSRWVFCSLWGIERVRDVRQWG